MAASAPLQATNGGSRPVPDPTVLTDQAIAKSDRAMRDYVDGQLAVRDERLSGIDEATKLRLGGLIDVEKRMDDALAASVRLTDEKFMGVAVQFRERDTRSEREARDNKVAVDAAFAAQKEAAAKQDEANAKAIDKSERNTADTITKNQALSEATTKALSDGLAEVKERITRIESAKLGATENRSGLYATVGIIVTLGLFGMAVVAFLGDAGVAMWAADLMPRQTGDVVALILAGVVGVVVVLTTLTIMLVSLSHPAQDVGPAADAIGRIVGVLVGALVGYMAGRRVNGNGHP